MSLFFSFREAQESDASSIHSIHSLCIHELCSTHYTKDQIDTWAKRQTPERFAKFIAQKDTVFLVAETLESKEVIGFGHMGKSKDPRFSSHVDYEVYGFYISPSFGRRGVGKALMTELERQAIRLGCKGYMGVCATLNAVPFYEKCGYVVIKEGVHCLGSTCVDLECKIMEKQL